MSLKGTVSGNPVTKSGDLLKELGTSIHHPYCKLIIAHLIGDCPQFFQSYAGTQVTLSHGYRFQPFIGCHHLLIRICFLDLASMVNNGHREETRPMEIDICLGLDLVKRISSLFNSLATIWFTNSEPLSE